MDLRANLKSVKKDDTEKVCLDREKIKNNVKDVQTPHTDTVQLYHVKQVFYPEGKRGHSFRFTIIMTLEGKTENMPFLCMCVCVR